MNMNIITELFEELKIRIELINKKLDEQQKLKSDQEFSILPIDLLDDAVVETMIKLTPKVDLSEIKEMIETLETQNFRIQRIVTASVEDMKIIVDENAHQYHHYSFEFKSTKVVILFIVLFLMFIGSFIFNIIQYNDTKKLQDNDVKYRCVKAMGGISKAKLYDMESAFNDISNSEKKDEYKREVILWEKKVQERAEEIEQANINEEQAKQLTKEAKKIREKR